jgi:hypothetical protein
MGLGTLPKADVVEVLGTRGVREIAVMTKGHRSDQQSVSNQQAGESFQLTNASGLSSL